MKELKILAIGNSFSNDATWYLWDMLNSLGVKATVGNLYIPGCSVDTHYKNAYDPENAIEYTYYKNTSGQWNEAPCNLEYALKDEEWDVITFQQASKVSGVPESLENLHALAFFVRRRVPASCRFYWHMTWAYQRDADNVNFINYGRDQMQMYRAICSTAENTVMKTGLFDKLIPAGTAVQNLRSSYLGDTLTRDGYHLNYRHGRFAAALTWACVLAEKDPESMSWRITDGSAFPKEDIIPIYNAVSDAIKEPFKLTEREME